MDLWTKALLIVVPAILCTVLMWWAVPQVLPGLFRHDHDYDENEKE